jgi:hypothetical protein
MHLSLESRYPPPAKNVVQEDHSYRNLHRCVEHHVQEIPRIHNVAQISGYEVIDLSDEIAGAAGTFMGGLGPLALGLAAA